MKDLTRKCNDESLNSPAWIAASVMSELLTQAAPQAFGKLLTEQIRELTGAHTIILLTHEPGQCAPLYICPPRHSSLFTPDELSQLCPACTPGDIPLKIRDFPQDHPLIGILQNKQIDSALRIPMTFGGKLNGSLTLLNLPELDRIEDVLGMLDFLAPFLGIGLQNVFAQQKLHKYQHQLEDTVAERTTELEEINQSLNDARLAALNMMEDTVADKERLYESRENLKITLESIGDAVISTDTTGRIVMMNPIAESLTGWTQQDAVGQPLETVFYIISEDTRAPVESPVTVVLNSGDLVDPASLTLLSSKDGREIPIAYSGAPIKDETDKLTGVVVVFRDQTKERRARLITETHLDLLKYAISHSLDEVLTKTLNAVEILIDSPISFYHFVADDQKTLSLQQWSTRTLSKCAHTGPKETNYKGMHYDVSQAGVWADCLKENKPVIHNDYESLPHKKGCPKGHPSIIRELVVPVLRGDKVVSILGVGNKPEDYTQDDVDIVSYFADITWEIVERTRAAEALENSETRYRMLFENMTDGFALHEMIFNDQGNPVDYRYLQVNPAFTQIIGITEEQAVGRTAKELLPKLEDHWIEPYAKVVKTGRPISLENYSQDLGKYLEVHAFRPAPGQFAVVITDITERRNMEQKLELTQFAVDHLKDASYWTNEDGQFVYVNEASSTALGYTKDELLQMHIWEIDPSIEKHNWSIKFNKIKEKGNSLFESTHFRKDGTPFPVEIKVNYIEFGDAKLICEFAHDITERKQAEKQIAFEQNLFRDFMDTIPAAISFKDLEGRFVKVNPAALQGRREEELIGNTDFDFTPEDAAKRFREQELQVIETEQVVQAEEHANDNWAFATKAPWYDENGKLAGTYGISWDITERKRAEKQIAFEQKLFSNFMDTVPARISFKNLESQFFKVNKEKRLNMGLPDSEIIGKSDADFMPGNQAKKSRLDELQVMDSEQVIQTEEQIHDRWVFTTKAPLYNENGKLTGTFCISWDITDRKKAETDLEESRRFLRTIIDTIPIRVFWKDSDSVYLGSNLSFAHDAGLKRQEELVGRTDYDMAWTEEQAELYFTDDQSVMRTGVPKLNFEEQQATRNGEIIWLKTNKIPLTDTQNNVIGMLGTYEDISEQKRMREAIEKRIIALTQPLENTADIAFEELFNLEEIQRVQDEFSQAAGIASIITTPEGTPLTAPSNFTRLCKDIIRKTEKGCANCAKSDAALGRYSPDGPIVQPCLSGGLWDAGASIKIGGRHIANWLVGQVRDETQTDEHMRAYAREIGADETEFMEAYAEVPKMSRKHFEEIAQAIYTLAQRLSDSAYQNIQQARFINKQKKAEEGLRESEARFKSLHNASFGGIAIHDQGIILECNQGLSNMTGYSEEELIGMSGLDLLVESSRGLVLNHIQSGYEKTYEATGLRKNGEQYPLRLEARNVGYKGKKVRTVEFRDITEQKKAQQAVKENEARFRDLLEHMDLIPVQGYNEAREVIYWNNASTRVYGYSQEEALGRKIEDLIIPTVMREEVIRLANAWYSGGLEIPSGECILQDCHGQPVAVYSSHIMRATNSGVKEMFCIDVDLRDLKAAEDQMRESRNLLRTIIDTMPDRVWWKDLDSRFIGSNVSHANDCGLDHPDQLIGKTDYDIFTSQEADSFVADDQQVIQSGKPKLDVQELKTQANGNTRWLETNKIPLKNAQGDIIGTVGTYADITGRKQAEEELQRLSTAIQQSPEAVVITDPNGIIQYVNPAFEAMSGYTSEEAIGRNPNILKSGKHSAAFYSTLWKTISSGKIWEGRFVNKRKDGSVYTEEASISPVRNATGDITGYAAIKRDITKELVQEEQMQQAQKMEAVGQLAGGIAHDFNNILQAVLGFSELLMLTLDPELKQPRSNVIGIQEAAKHAADLTRQLLAFSRKQDLELTYVDINQSVKQTRVLITSIIGEKIKVISTLEPNLNPAKADSQQIDRMLLNLALNARDAMPEGGELTLQTENVEFSEEDNKSSAQIQKGNFICLSVSDNGTGMSEETQQHIFEPFFTTKEPGKGTGLGLASIYGIVQKHNGWISVYSELNQGTTFKVFLPVYDVGESLPTVHNDRNTPNEVHGRGERILIVENDRAILDLSMKTLQRAGYTVEAAVSAKEAEGFFDKADEAFDLFFSDMTLPDNNGTNLAEALIEKQPNLAVLLCSGYSGKRINEDEIKQKGFFFLEKPFSIVNLLKQVHRALDQKKTTE